MYIQKKVLAIDIGGTNIKCAAVHSDGTIHNHKITATPRQLPSEELQEFFYKLVEDHLEEDVVGIGISTLGVVDEEKGIVTGACNNLRAIEGLPLKAMLERRFKLPVKIMNDVNAAAIGEGFCGAGKELQQFFCITLGTGIGGAFVYQKKVLPGVNGLSGEIGYLMGQDGENYEERASVKRLLKEYEKRAEAEGVDLDMIEDKEARYPDIFSKWIEQVAKGLCEIIFILDPGTIIVGGGISKRGSMLTDCIRTALDARLPSDFRGKTRVIPAKTGNAACLIGTATCFLHNEMSQSQMR